MKKNECVKLLDELNYKRKFAAMRELSNCGMHFRQLPIIDYIIANNGCTQNEIAKYLGITPSSIAISTKRLQKAGLIEKRIPEHNLRCKQLTVTKKGIKDAEKCRKALHDLNNRLFEGFSGEELDLLSGQLRRIIAKLPEREMPENLFELIASVNKFEEDDL